MSIALDILLIIVLSSICIQDFKERKISLLLVVVGILLGGAIHFQQQNASVFFLAIFINVVFVAVLFLILAIYSKLKMKQSIFEVFGLGDLLFFVLLAISLPIISFIVVFVFSLIFSGTIFMLIKQNMKEKTVPLAGLQSAFLILVLLINKFTNTIDIYVM